jgi:hypothetical protein
MSEIAQHCNGVRTMEPYKTKLKNARTWSRIFFACLILLLGGGALLLYCSLGLPKEDTKTVPLLTGPPEFILLALSVALAGYFRQIAGGGLTLRDKIRNDTVWNYPLDPEFTFTERKLEALDRLVIRLGVAGSFLIALTVVLAIRIGADTITRFLTVNDQGHAYALLSLMDFVIAEWIALLFIVLAFAHYFARGDEENIRGDARESEERSQLRLRARAGQAANPVVVGGWPKPNPTSQNHGQDSGAGGMGLVPTIGFVTGISLIIWALTRQYLDPDESLKRKAANRLKL